MPKPRIIPVPQERPFCCAECPLLGKRPTDEVPFNSKFTLRCFLPGYERLVTGRGSKQPKARNRCRPREYEKVFCTYSGDIPVSPTSFFKYQLDRTAWLYERDRRLAR